MLFDTHCHIYDEQFNNDLDSVLEKSKNNGVLKMLVPSDTLNSAYKCVELANKYHFIYCAIGIHPSEVENYSDEIQILNELKELVKKNPKIRAIGEIGLDYYWHKDNNVRQNQKKWFVQQINLANELKLPIIVHSREACEDTLEILNQNPPKYGCVFHCFSYSEEILDIVIKRGYYIGLDGPVTYKNALTPKNVAREVPLDHLLLETDSPYLSPSPNRGKRNDPSNLIYIANYIAELKGLDDEEIEEATYKNALRFFNIKENE